MSLKHGVCLFDEPSHPTSGVAVLEGEIRRVTRHTDLDSGVIWWTNIPYQTFKTQRLYELNNLRGEQLLRGRIPSLLAELGAENLDLVETAQLLDGIQQRCISLAQELWGIDIRGMQRLDWELKKHVIPSGRRLSGPLHGLLTASRDAHQYIVSSVYGRASNATTRTYMVPRLPYVRALLALPYPNPRGRWEHIEFDGGLALDPDNLPAPLTESSIAMVRINIRNLEAGRAEFSPFAKKTQQHKQQPRTWCALPEAMSYARDADVTLTHAWVGEAAPLQPALPYPGDELAFSFSAGLLAEAYYFALAAISNGASTGLEPLAAYLTAYDRVYLMRMARHFYDEGFNPLSTGTMRVVMSLAPADVPTADDVARELGMELPMRQATTNTATVDPLSA